MITFKQFIKERKNPLELAQRVARRYAKKAHRDPYAKVAKGSYIPFSKVAHPSTIASAITKYETHGHKVKDENESFKISDLHATQHHANISDLTKLKSKLSDTDPKHIHVITHKGKHLVSDGHNAIMAAKLRGEDSVKARHTNLDNVP